MTRFRVVVSREGAAVMRERSSGEIASAFGRKEHLVDANRYHETTTVLKIEGNVPRLRVRSAHLVGYLPPIE